MRRLLVALAVSLSVSGAMTASVCAAAPAAASSTTPATVKALQHLETVSYQAATSFFLYAVLNRDPTHLKKMQGYIANGDSLVQEIGNSAITAKWAPFKQALTTAKFTSEGEVENNSLNNVDGALTGLAQLVRSQRMDQRTTANTASDKMADMLYDQHVLMQTMTTAYLRKSADYFGGAIVASTAPTVEIDQLANKFQAQLEQLSKFYAKNPGVAPLLREVTTKWTFIRGSFINFNENNVPFIVGRYNEQITEKLLAAYEKAL